MANGQKNSKKIAKKYVDKTYSLGVLSTIIILFRKLENNNGSSKKKS